MISADLVEVLSSGGGAATEQAAGDVVWLGVVGAGR